jgi:hypothetical protein
MTALSSLPFFALLKIAQYDKNDDATSVCSLVFNTEETKGM